MAKNQPGHAVKSIDCGSNLHGNSTHHITLLFSLNKIGNRDLKNQMVRRVPLSLPSKITLKCPLQGKKITSGTAVWCPTLLYFFS